ncbi:hypothetical protein F1241_13950, partial [Clostridioides difficile]|nr:hypothetical protein [Clostridioides difficile]
ATGAIGFGVTGPTGPTGATGAKEKSQKTLTPTTRSKKYQYKKKKTKYFLEGMIR